LLQAANMLGNGFAMLVGPAVVKYNNTVEEAITGNKLPLIQTLKKKNVLVSSIIVLLELN
jgi:hypothetical protein